MTPTDNSLAERELLRDAHRLLRENRADASLALIRDALRRGSLSPQSMERAGKLILDALTLDPIYHQAYNPAWPVYDVMAQEFDCRRRAGCRFANDD